MIDLTDSNNVPAERTAVALGLFDGLHTGHQAVIHRAVDFIPMGYSPAVFTFKTDTVTSKGDGGVECILSHELKYELLSRLGIKYIYSPDFLNFKELSAREFVLLVLRDKFKAKYVVCGEDFRFGKGASCGRAELSLLCNEQGIEVVVVPPERIDGDIVSSTRIRKFIKSGEIDKANRLLGYEFRIKLNVIHGNQIGRTLDFPTINQKFPKYQIVPKFGVYASRVTIDGKTHMAITNIGVKPTVGGTTPLAETFILDYNGNLYGEPVEVSLSKFIRPEKKFSSLEELKEAISKDISAVKAI